MRTVRATVIAATLCSLVWGCEAPSAPVIHDSLPARGELTFAVGSDLRKFAMGVAECRHAERLGEPVLTVVAPATFHAETRHGQVRPHLLAAHLPPDLGPEPVHFARGTPDAPSVYAATASVHGESFIGIKFPLVQIVAEDVTNGPPAYECRASRTGDTLHVTCNAGLVTPHAAAGNRDPVGSFTATVECVPNP